LALWRKISSDPWMNCIKNSPVGSWCWFWAMNMGHSELVWVVAVCVDCRPLGPCAWVGLLEDIADWLSHFSLRPTLQGFFYYRLNIRNPKTQNMKWSTIWNFQKSTHWKSLRLWSIIDFGFPR
jgi:hypothetical protein